MATTKLANLSKEELAELLSAKRKEICRIEQELLREIETEFQGREQEEAKEQEKAQEKGEESSKGKSAAKLGAGEKEKKDENAPNKSNTSEENKTAAAEKAQEEESDEYDIWKAPKWCIPIRADVRNFDFKKLAETQRKLTGKSTGYSSDLCFIDTFYRPPFRRDHDRSAMATSDFEPN